jgi:Zn ribbon nucleic-acid-binding protein
MHCPKCSTKTGSKGLVEPNIAFTTDGKVKEIRCVNCGWRPRSIGVTHLNIRRQRKWVFKKPHELKVA